MDAPYPSTVNKLCGTNVRLTFQKTVRSDDEDLDAIADVPLRARIGRSKAPVKYNFGESDEDEDV